MFSPSSVNQSRDTFIPYNGENEWRYRVNRLCNVRIKYYIKYLIQATGSKLLQLLDFNIYCYINRFVLSNYARVR